jgi:hypothetical protein
MHPLQMIMHLILPWKRFSSSLTPLTPLHRAPKLWLRSHGRVFCCVVSPELNDAAKCLVEAPRCEAFEVVLARVAIAEECANGYMARGRGLTVVIR